MTNISSPSFATTHSLRPKVSLPPPEKSFCRALVLFVGPLFWTSGDISSEFQSHSGSSHLHALLPVHIGFLRFTSGATPANLLVATMAANAFSHLPFQVAVYTSFACTFNMFNRVCPVVSQITTLIRYLLFVYVQ